MKLSDYDTKNLVAENEKQALYLVCYGKNYYFYIKYKDIKEGFTTLAGVNWDLTNKTKFVTNAYSVAVDHFGFKPSEVDTCYPKNVIVVLSKPQQIAINTAIMLLGSSNSDHAEQVNFHLSQIKSQF